MLRCRILPLAGPGALVFLVLAWPGAPADGQSGACTPGQGPAAVQRLQNSFSAQDQTAQVRLRSRELPADPACPLPGLEGIFYLTLAGSMSPELERELAADGATVAGFVPPSTYLMRQRPNAARTALQARIRAGRGVVGTLIREPADVASPEVWSARERGWQRTTLRVLFTRDCDAARADNLLAACGGRLGRDNLATRSADVVADAVALDTLLGSTWVEYVDFVREWRGFNRDSVACARANLVMNLPLGLNGNGETVGVWDSGGSAPHTDFGNRLTVIDPYVGGNHGKHATHVMGTIIGGGLGGPAAKGFAPEAKGVAYDWSGDVHAERRSLRYNLMHTVDNHSYGTIYPGNYDIYAMQADFDSRDMLMTMCKAAGNFGPNDGTVSADSCIKNGFCVGAVDDGGTHTMNSAFSSRGPAPDGRLVPHICANGVDLLSTTPGNAYEVFSGTSMATPSMSGCVTLLSQHWKNIHGGMELAPDMARTIFFHTARDQGNPGPDYEYGFGLVDLKAACDLVGVDANGHGKNLVRGSVGGGNYVDYTASILNPISEFKVTLSWLDEAGTPGAAIALVNDLDLELHDPMGTIHYPYAGLTTSGSASYQWTQLAANRRDNAEQAVVANPQVGMWKIRVRGYRVVTAGTLVGFVLASNVQTDRVAVRALPSSPPSAASPAAIPGTPGLEYNLDIASTGNVRQVRLYVNARHNQRGQLEVALTHPDGTRVLVNAAGQTGADAMRPGLFAIIPDTRRSSEDIARFCGKPAAGRWRATLTDVAGVFGELTFIALEVDIVSGAAANQRPTADAGPNVQVVSNGQATLNGSGSQDPDGDPLLYQWTQLTGPTVTINGANNAVATFIAPTTTLPILMTFRLTVTDPYMYSSSDTMQVDVGPPSLSNRPPVADAGADAGAFPNQLVELNGLSSSDPDGDALDYVWAQTGGAAAVSLSSTTSATPTFSAPGSEDRLVFKLLVDDRKGGIHTDTVVVWVNFKGQVGPIVEQPTQPWVQHEKGTSCAATGHGAATLLPLAMFALAWRRRKRRPT